MRVVIQSKHSLVVESSGRSLLLVLAVVVPLHGLLIFSNIRDLYAYSHPWLASLTIGVFALAYVMLAALSFGPLADKYTVTFHRLKSQVTIERLLFGKWRAEMTVPFTDFEKFEVSPPENGGYCRIRYPDGRTRRLFRIRPGDDFGPVQHLEEVTGKKTDMVM